MAFRWRAMGRLYKLWTAKEYDDLIILCNLMLSKNPTDYLAFYYRGLANEELKQLDLAIDDLKTSQTLLTTNKRKNWVKEYLAKIPIQLSRIYRKKQDKEKAIDYADKAVQADNGEIDGLKWRAFLKEDFGDYIGASEDLNEALKRKPADKTLTKMRDRLTYIIIEDKRETASR
jgi:tetratricopeptide (TPR) repeat protein